MKYRILGKSGISVSEIGVGGHQNMDGETPVMSDVDRAKIIERALDLGVNYFDSSWDPETESLGKSLKILGRRDECIVTMIAGVFQNLEPNTSKYWAKKTVRQDIDRALSVFGFENFDISLTCMGGKWYGHAMIEGALEAMNEAKQNGKTKAIGISDHQDGEFLSFMIERYNEVLDMVMYPFSYIHRSAVEKNLHLVKKYNIGFVAMKPLAQKHIFINPDFIKYTKTVTYTPAAAALRWVLEHREVSVVLAAVNSIDEIEDNCSASV